MPMRALRASTSYASGHITANLWLSTAICVGLTIVALLLMRAGTLGFTGAWGDAAAFFACVAGILVMLQSQVGYISPHVTVDDDA